MLSSSRLKARDEPGQNPLSHSPYDPIFHLVCLNLAALPGNLKPHRVVGFRTQKVVNGYPLSRGDLVVRDESRLCAENEHVWSDRDRRKHRRPGNHILQAASEVLSSELDPELLSSLSNGRCHQVRIGRVPAAARQRDVTRPGVPAPLGPANQKDGIRIRSENDSHCSPDQRWIVFGAGGVATEYLL
jgi:hypothetical protein